MALHSNVWKDGLFKGKVVYCTGGAGTICSGQVKALVKLGADAAITGRRQEKLDTMCKEIEAIRPGARCIGVSADVRNLSQMQASVEKTLQVLGRIDYVIAGAAGNFLAPLRSLSASAFKAVIDIDTMGSYNTFLATRDAVVKTKGQYIFVSATFHYRGVPLQMHVAAAKAAVDQISNSIAIEYGPLGVRSNVIAPGPIAGTEGMARLSSSKHHERSIRLVPLQRWGKISEIADATIFLFSDAASYVTGQTLIVDGASHRIEMGLTSAYPDSVLDDTFLEKLGVGGSKRTTTKGSKL